MASRVLLAAVVLTCCLAVGVFADSTDHHGGRRKHHKHSAHAPSVHPPAKSPVYPPVKAPVKPPVHAPVYPPVKAPVSPPAHTKVYPPLNGAPVPVRKLVAVEGVVYCKSCKYKGVDTLLGATPIKGAVVLLNCSKTDYPFKVNGTTDRNGYFFISPPETYPFAWHKCRVTLLSSPLATCNQTTNLNHGIYGSILPRRRKPRVPVYPLGYDVFTVGPFAFEPSPMIPCP